MNRFTEILGTKMLFADGAMGTMLQSAGLPDGYLPDLWVLEQPEKIKAVHRAYIEAGCNIITTDTFGTNPIKLSSCGADVGEIAAGAVRLVKEEIALSERDDCFAALDIGPTGKLLEPLGDLSFNDAVKSFSQTIKAGAEAGADLVLIETMSDTYELKAAIIAAKESCSLPIVCTMVFGADGKLLTGADIETATAIADSLGVTALGMNCGLGPESMLPLVEKMRSFTSLSLIISPNAGLPKSENGRTYYDVSPADFAEEMKKIAPYTAVLGGCCGTTPTHISEMIKHCKAFLPAKPPEIDIMRVCSYSKCVRIDEKPVIIGERINPTGKKRFKQALAENDMDYILKEGLTQEENGAHILDVNVGLPEIDERAMLTAAVAALQRVTRLPLQIDTSDVEAMEAALRIYNGKPLVNSVNGKEENLHAVLPLVKKYGGAVVGLALDEDGIPETPEGRFKIAKKIVDTALSYGIPRRDIIIDALTLPISADADAAKKTLTALKRIREELNVKTVLGVSNISFGLPQRVNINATFFTLALENGLSAGIINPLSREMMNSYYSFCALRAMDTNCENYINHCSAAPEAKTEKKEEQMTLCSAVIKGLSEQAGKIAYNLGKDGDPIEIINSELVPALDTVGEGFEKGSVYLPQLLMSAEAAKAAFDSLKTFMTETDGEKGGTVIVATVHGDIHDIGKNIVKVLLENYRFNVIDLGKDVPPEEIVKATKENCVRLVGLSALMTTTVPAMAETIKLLNEQCPKTKTVVGGAVLTQDYADMIGADHYAKDAMETVRYAQEILGNN